MATETLYPGVYVNEVQSGAAPIEGAGTSTAGFVGYSKRGPKGVPTLVTSWTDFVNKFAYGLDTPFSANSNLAYSVYGFFQNGGTRAFIVRAASAEAAKASAIFTDGATTPANTVTVTATDEGAYGNDVSVKLVVSEGETALYDVTVKYKGDVVATYLKVSLDSASEDFAEYKINGVDKFISVDVIGTTIAAGELGVDKALSSGNDGLTTVTDSDLIEAFDKFDTVRVNLLVCPESQSTAVNDKGLSYAEKSLSFFLVEGLKDSTIAAIQTEREAYSGEYGALYYPWIKVNDPIAKGQDKGRFVPVCGHVAGVIARIDGNRGVFKAPAGVEAVVRGAIDLKTKVTDVEQSLLNPKSINAVRSIPGAGIVVWGARTLSANPAVKYINVRRHLLFVRESIQNSTRWAIFEPNNEVLWKRLNSAARGFLLGEYKKGAFKGSVEEAFFVKCDAEINPQSEIDLGRVNMSIGVAENKPGEFLVVNISQISGVSE